MIANPIMPTITSPQLIDVPLGELQTVLTTGLSWLDNAYGKAQRHVKTVDGKQVFYPAVYYGQKDYLPVFPDEHLGAFSFFDVEDSEDFQTYNRNQYNQLKARVGLIVWFDFRDVYPVDWQSRTLEHVKSEVLRVLTSERLSNQARFTPEGFRERAENIYKDYTHREIQNQFRMRPYGGFRLDGTLIYNEKCP